MNPLPEIDADFLLVTLQKLLNIPSPTGFTEPAVKFCEGTLEDIPGVTLARTRKGALLASLGGERDDAPRSLTTTSRF